MAIATNNPASGQSLFWADLVRDLGDPDFLREYIVESMRIATIGGLVDALDAAREAATMSKADLARAIGAEPAVVRRLFSKDNVNPTLGTVAQVAAALGLRITVEKLPASERKVVTEPLLTGLASNPLVVAERLTSLRTSRGTAVAAKGPAKSQAKDRGLRAKNSSPRARTPA
jgi:transcriptional regulator with XRE-family HTH domain